MLQQYPPSVSFAANSGDNLSSLCVCQPSSPVPIVKPNKVVCSGNAHMVESTSPKTGRREEGRERVRESETVGNGALESGRK